MNHPFLFYVPAALIALILFLLILTFNWIGFRYRQMLLRNKTKEEIEGIGTIEGAMLGLMALVMAFTFSAAAEKFDERRKLIVEEANTIGTAILRSDMYSDSNRKLFRADFAKYVESRIAYYDAVDNEEKIEIALRDAATYSQRVWSRAARLSQNLENRVQSELMIPAVNAMIDITTTRESSRVFKVPEIILVILFLLTVTAAFLVGYGNKGKRLQTVMVIGFALITTMTVYLILELDRPRRGIITVDRAEKNILDLRNAFMESR
jgi:hypothetical protein